MRVPVPQDPDQRRVLAASFVDALGTGLFLPLSVIYLTRIVGLSPTRVGLGLTIAGFVAVVVAPVAGPLLDRFAARSIVLACFAVSAAGFLAYIAVDSFASFAAVAIVLQLASRVERPATAILALGVASGPDRVVALAWQQSVRNLGYAVGGLLAGLALVVDGKTPFVVLLAANAASYAIASMLVLRLPAVRPAVSTGNAGEKLGYRQVVQDRPYVALALLNVLVALNDSLLRVAMPLWILLRTDAPLPLTGLLFALNTALVVLLQVRTTRNIAAPRGIARSYRTAALSFVVACVCFALAAGAAQVAAIVLLVLALAALTVGELETTAGEWFLSVELAPARLRGRYLSLYKSSMSLQQAIGPALVTFAVVDWGRLGWAALALILVTGSLASGRVAVRETGVRLATAEAA
jgi:MFS family permease